MRTETTSGAEAQQTSLLFMSRKYQNPSTTFWVLSC